MMNNFWKNLHEHNYEEALASLNKSSKEEKVELLKLLHLQARNASMPHSMSVHVRKLKPGKTFDDFYQAWPPEDVDTDPVTIGGKTYTQYFPIPIRVFHAYDMENPDEIVTVSLNWFEDDQKFQKYVEEYSKSESNSRRRDKQAKVIDKTFYKLAKITTDDEIGTPF